MRGVSYNIKQTKTIIPISKITKDYLPVILLIYEHCF